MRRGHDLLKPFTPVNSALPSEFCINIIQQTNRCLSTDTITREYHSQKCSFTEVNTPLTDTIAQSHKPSLNISQLLLPEGKLKIS